MRKVPVGFRFEPTNEDLIYYLRKKVNGEPVPHGILPECDIYGDKEPWKIFDKNSKESFYVFTKLKRKSKSRIERMAGCGTWDGRQNSDVKDNTRKLIGFDKYFVFEVEEDLKINGHWVMHEFSLAGEESNDYVICVIRNKESKKNLEGDQINNTDETIRATKPHARKQGNDGNQKSKQRKLNPGQNNQKQKNVQITSNTMDNIEKKKIGANIISEPIKKLEPASSLNLANQFKEEEEDIMAPYVPQSEPAAPVFQYMESTSSQYEYEFVEELMGPYMMASYMMESYLPQSNLNVEPLSTLELTPMMMFDFYHKNSSDWVDQQSPKQVSENMLPNTNIGATVPVNTNFQN